MHTLDQKIKNLMSHGFSKLDRPYAYFTENSLYSLEYLLETDLRDLRKKMPLLYGISKPADQASQEMIEVFGKDKAVWLETTGLKKFDKPMILRRGMYMLSEDYIRETPLSKLLNDYFSYDGSILIRTADNTPIKTEASS